MNPISKIEFVNVILHTKVAFLSEEEDEHRVRLIFERHKEHLMKIAHASIDSHIAIEAVLFSLCGSRGIRYRRTFVYATFIKIINEYCLCAALSMITIMDFFFSII